MIRLRKIIRGRRSQPLMHATEISGNDLSDEDDYHKGFGCEQNLRNVVDVCNRQSPQRTPTQNASPKIVSGLHILIGHSQLTKRTRLIGGELHNRLSSTPRRDMKHQLNGQAEMRLSEVSILDLNDDCLREIFRYLNQMDMATVANVCTQFRKLIVTDDLLESI